MKVKNNSGFPAELLRTSGPDEVMYNNMTVRARYSIADSGLALLPVEEQPAGIRTEALEDDTFGTLEPDPAFPRSGTDVIVHAYARATWTSDPSVVRLEAGPYRETLIIWGDRRWEESRGQLCASKPGPIDAPVAIAYTEAYGGQCPSEHGPLTCPANPLGKGFALSRAGAVGLPLPRIELADQLIQAWDDRPTPAGFAAYPMNWSCRLEQMVTMDERGEPRLTPDNRIFNLAHPRLSGSELQPGHALRLEGVDVPGGAGRAGVQFSVPGPPLRLEVQLGGWRGEVPLKISELFVDLANSIVEICWNGIFDYAFEARQARTATLMSTE